MHESIFHQLDRWASFPNYQLERRADIFFAVHLGQILENIKGISIEMIIPEFPVRIGTIYKNINIDKSYKIDYVVKIKDRAKVLFVELKTDTGSRRDSQDKYLRAAQEVGFTELLGGVSRIYDVTGYKKKYRSLISDLEQAGMVRFSEDEDRVYVLDINYETEVIYIQPHGGSNDSEIGFEQIASVLESSSDPLTLRFCKSLRKWAAN